MEETWSVSDVYLLTKGPEGELAVPHLTLTFADSGLALERADGTSIWESSWGELHALSPVERSVLPDGRTGVVVVVVERGQRDRHRFVLATDDAPGMEDALRAGARAHGLRTTAARPAVSRLLTVVLVVAAFATLTALLLSAAHVIRF